MAKGSSSANQTENITDNRVINAGDGLLLKDIGDISVSTVDADVVAAALGMTSRTIGDALGVVDSISIGLENTAREAMTATRGIAQDSLSANLTLAQHYGDNTLAILEGAGGMVQQVLDSNQTLATAVGATAANTMTTLRDTLSATLGSDNLAGSAEQSGGITGWMSRNAGLTALFTVGAFALLLVAKRKKKA
jgi:hypothetical protein